MKEPYEIYWDELSREMKRRFRQPAPSDADLQEAEYAAAEAVAYHLVEQLHFGPGEAQEVVEAFRAAKVDKEQLKHVWTDIVLRRQRRH